MVASRAVNWPAFCAKGEIMRSVFLMLPVPCYLYWQSCERVDTYISEDLWEVTSHICEQLTDEGF